MILDDSWNVKAKLICRYAPGVSAKVGRYDVLFYCPGNTVVLYRPYDKRWKLLLDQSWHGTGIKALVKYLRSL